MNSILAAVLALVVWTLIIWVWMYATRIPAMQKAGIKPQRAQEPDSLDSLPLSVRQIAYNYNHLMEQPTIFYALAFVTFLAGHENGTTIALAWAYVALRVVHSLIQCTVNNVMARFTVFSISTIVLIVWATIEVLAVI